MNKMSFIKGMGIGVAVGGVVGMVAAPKKRSKSSIGKALKNVGTAVESVANSIGL